MERRGQWQLGVAGPGGEGARRGSVDYEEITTQLSSDECWQLLGAGHPGRFAYRVGEDVMILPSGSRGGWHW